MASSFSWKDEWLTAFKQLPHIAFDLDERIIRSYWDDFALDYSNGVGRTSDLDMMVIDHLSEREIIRTGDRVLDIGCGTGNFSIPFASIAREVDALDISASMLNILRSRASAEGCDNIIYTNERWETYEPGSSFDLVFSSFCPATCNLESVLKMESMSKGHCCILTMAPGSDRDIYSEVCGELTGRGLSNRAYDAIMPMSVLHEMGREPEMRQFSIENGGRIDEQELERSLIGYVSCFIEIDDRQRDIIRERVVRASREPRPERAKAAMILWNSSSAIC
ncbi:MAG: class I SAM-dependent methyltransferase [Methanomassiliicoccales archaeon]